MLSIKPDRPVDALTVAVSREIDYIARELKLPYFLAGAMARDIVLTHVFGIDTGIGTRDMDFGVAVRNWERFELLKDTLVGRRPLVTLFFDAYWSITKPIRRFGFGGIGAASSRIAVIKPAIA